MKCQALRDWVLQCESMSARTWPKRMVKHVKRCRPCRHFARSILRLEDAWKHQSLPKAAKKPSAAFLEQIAELEQPPAKPEKPKSKPRRALLPFRPLRLLGAAAAVFVVGVGVLLFLLATAGTSRASSSDVVERLIELNLEMTNAEGAERQRLLDENDKKFADEIANAKLSDDERELAENLLEAARLLAASDDPDDEAEYFAHLGEELKTRVERAEKKGNEKEFERFSQFYSRFIAHDMRPFFERMKHMKPPEKGPEKFGDKKFEKGPGFFDKGPGFFDKGKGAFGGKGGPDKGGFSKGGPGAFGKGWPFGKKGGFEKGGFEKGGPGKGGDRDKNREEFIRKLNEDRIRAQEAWQKKMGPIFMPLPLGKKK